MIHIRRTKNNQVIKLKSVSYVFNEKLPSTANIRDSKYAVEVLHENNSCYTETGFNANVEAAVTIHQARIIAI